MNKSNLLGRYVLSFGLSIVMVVFIFADICFPDEIKREINHEQSLKIFKNNINKPGKYIGNVILWQYSVPPCYNLGIDCGPGGNHPVYHLKIKLLKNNSVVESDFYFGIVFYKKGKALFDTHNCSDYGQAGLHGCVTDAADKYLKTGTKIEIEIGCGKDAGCYIHSVNTL